MIAADGRTGWIWEEGQLVLDENGQPLHVQGVLVDITARKRAERGNRAGTETIVLIEDEDLVRDALQQALESVGYRVIAPPTPGEAVLEAEAGDVDLVISDPPKAAFPLAELTNAVRDLLDAA